MTKKQKKQAEEEAKWAPLIHSQIEALAQAGVLYTDVKDIMNLPEAEARHMWECLDRLAVLEKLSKVLISEIEVKSALGEIE